MAKTVKQATERDMLDRLNKRYGGVYRNGSTQLVRWIRAEHVKSAPGWYAGGIADYVAVDVWQGMGLDAGTKFHGHEVKVSRSDFLNEIRNPEKAEQFKRYMDYWWLVVSDKNTVKDGELPSDWGLMVSHGKSLRVLVDAPKLSPEPMPVGLVTTLLRSTVKTTERVTRVLALEEFTEAEKWKDWIPDWQIAPDAHVQI